MEERMEKKGEEGIEEEKIIGAKRRATLQNPQRLRIQPLDYLERRQQYLQPLLFQPPNNRIIFQIIR